MYNSIRLATMMAIVLAIAGTIVIFSDENNADVTIDNSDDLQGYLQNGQYVFSEDTAISGNVTIDKSVLVKGDITLNLSGATLTYTDESAFIVDNGNKLTVTNYTGILNVDVNGGQIVADSNFSMNGSMDGGSIEIPRNKTISLRDGFSYNSGNISVSGVLNAIGITNYEGIECVDSGGAGYESLAYLFTLSGNELTLSKVITPSDGSDYYADIPNRVAGHNVTTIGSNAFDGCNSLSEVRFNNNNNKTIAANAFSGDHAIETVRAIKVTTVENGAFTGADSISTIVLSSLKSVSSSTFKGCIGLSSLTLSSACTIDDGAFADLPKLKTVSLGSVSYTVDPSGNLTQADANNSNFVIETIMGPYYYLDLATAVKSAENESTIEMLKDTTIEPITIEKTTLTIDLGGYQLTIDDSTVQRDVSTYGIDFIGGTLTIKNGYIVDARDSTDRNGGYTAVNSIGNLNIEDVDLTIYDAAYNAGTNNIGYRISNSRTLTISGDSTIISNHTADADKGSVGVVVLGLGNMVNTTNLVLEDDTTISVGQYGISGNGTIPGADSSTDYRGTTITIRDNAQVTATNGWGIYHPQDGTLNIQDNANVSGLTGIEIRSGTLNMTGGTVESIATESNAFAIDADSGGATTTGVGIAVVQHTTKLNITVDVSGGDVKGYYAVFQEDVAENGDESAQEIDITLRSGNFESTGTGSVTTNDKTYAPSAVYGEQEKDMVVGGNYSSDVSDYVAEGSEIQQNPDGSFVVTSEEDTQSPYPPIWDDDDDYVPPIYVPSQTNDDDDTVKIVACAAAAVVAAIMAAFLVLGNKKD